eukprot:1137210-Pelagomonas_calceolata.AAC.5
MAKFTRGHYDPRVRLVWKLVKYKGHQIEELSSYSLPSYTAFLTLTWRHGPASVPLMMATYEIANGIAMLCVLRYHKMHLEDPHAHDSTPQADMGVQPMAYPSACCNALLMLNFIAIALVCSCAFLKKP